jgi:hypothetical protein
MPLQDSVKQEFVEVVNSSPVLLKRVALRGGVVFGSRSFKVCMKLRLNLVLRGAIGGHKTPYREGRGNALVAKGLLNQGASYYARVHPQNNTAEFPGYSRDFPRLTLATVRTLSADSGSLAFIKGFPGNP